MTQIEQVLNAYRNGAENSLEVASATGMDIPTCSSYSNVLLKKGLLIRSDDGKSKTHRYEFVERRGRLPHMACAKCWKRFPARIRGCFVEHDGDRPVQFCSAECKAKWKEFKTWKDEKRELWRASALLRTAKKLCKDPEALAAYRLREPGSRLAGSLQV